MQLSLIDVLDCIQVSHEKCKYFRNHGHHYRQNNLNNRLLRSKKRKYEESEKKILEII